MSKTPIFISGIGRSGTSALIKSVAEHGDVVKPNRIGEAPFVSHFINSLLEFEETSPNKEYNLKNYQLGEAERAQEFTRLLSMCQYGTDICTDDVQGKHWIAKVSLSEPAYKKASSLFGDVRIIYIMRNGIEVVNSAKSFDGFANLSFEQLCTRWVDNINQCRYVHNAPNCAVLKHHELVQNPHAVYERVFQELDLQQDDAPAEFIKSNLFNSSFDATSKLESTADVFRARLKCWDEWTEEERETFIRICDDLMAEFDFPRPYESNDQRERESAAAAATAAVDQISVVDNTESPQYSQFEEKMLQSMNAAQFDYFSNPSVKGGYFFMENPKVASTSLLKGLHMLELGEGVEPKGDPHQRNLSPIPKMSTLTDSSKAEMLFSQEVFKFAFVRNPYTRLLSAYLSKVDKPLPAKAEILGAMKGVHKREIKDLSERVSFAEFVDVVVNQDALKMNPHWNHQVDQTLHGLIEYDFIGRFESLAEDYGFICSKLFGKSTSRLSQSKNKTSSTSLVSEYYDDQLAEKVFDKFEEDFSVFGYDKDIRLAAATSAEQADPYRKAS